MANGLGQNDRTPVQWFGNCDKSLLFIYVFLHPPPVYNSFSILTHTRTQLLYIHSHSYKNTRGYKHLHTTHTRFYAGISVYGAYTFYICVPIHVLALLYTRCRRRLFLMISNGLYNRKSITDIQTHTHSPGQDALRMSFDVCVRSSDMRA